MGEELVTNLATATGLPQDMINREISALIQKSGKDINTLTLEDLRLIVAEYLQDTLLSLKEQMDSLS